MLNHHKIMHSALGCALAFSVGACSDDIRLTDTTETTVPQSGGVAMSSDGLATVDLPENALAEETVITISINRDRQIEDLRSAVYELGPDGTQFTTPVTLKIQLDAAPEADHEVYIANLDDAEPLVLESTYDSETRTVSAQLAHFSSYGAFSSRRGDRRCEGPNPQGCSSDSDCGSDEVCTTDPAVCLPSSCSCDAATGTWICTEDCGAGTCVESPDVVFCGGFAGRTCADDEFCDFASSGCDFADASGVCRPRPEACTEQYDPVCGCDGQTYGNACSAHAAGIDVNTEGECGGNGGCSEPNPQGCTDDSQCGEDQACVTGNGICNPSQCSCDPVTGRWGCTRDCVGECRDRVDPPVCEDNPAGCSSDEQCGEGMTCTHDLEVCLPSSCNCDPMTGLWACTRDCGGGVCVPAAETCGTIAGLTCPDGQYCHLEDCSVSDSAGTCRPRPEACTQEYDPVCGCDGRTYGNACSAASAGVTVSATGECDSACGENPEGCVNDSECAAGEFCFSGDDVCNPSSCFCDPATGGWGCTDDCVGECRPRENNGNCPGQNPAGCNEDSDCGEGKRCSTEHEICAPSACNCDPMTGAWLCTTDCNGGVCIDDTEEVYCGGWLGDTCQDTEFCDFASSGCDFADASGVCRPRPEACTQQVDPVCGCDGRTYSNECMAHAAGIDVNLPGPCESNDR